MTFNENVPCVSKCCLDDDAEIEPPMLMNQLITPFVWVNHEEPHDWFRLVIENMWGKKNLF